MEWSSLVFLEGIGIVKYFCGKYVDCMFLSFYVFDKRVRGTEINRRPVKCIHDSTKVVCSNVISDDVH